MIQIFECRNCCQKPEKFTILICNHVICQQCWAKISQKRQGVTSVVCKCGQITYSILNTPTITSNIQSNQNTSKQTQKTVECSEFKLPQQQKYLKTENNHNQSVLFERSSYKIPHKNNNKLNNSQYVSENGSPRLLSSLTKSSSDVSKQLNKQLKFLDIRLNKALEDMKKHYRFLIQTILDDYQRLINNIKSYYFDQLGQKDQYHINLSTQIQKKYNRHIGSRISNFIEQMNDFTSSAAYIPIDTRQRQGRATVCIHRSRSKCKLQPKYHHKICLIPYHCENKCINRDLNQSGIIERRQRKKLNKKVLRYNTEKCRLQ